MVRACRVGNESEERVSAGARRKMRSAVGGDVRKAPRLLRRMWIMEGDLWHLPTLPCWRAPNWRRGCLRILSRISRAGNRPRTMNMDHGSDELINGCALNWFSGALVLR